MPDSNKKQSSKAEQNYLEWFKKAQEDEWMANYALKEDGPPNQIGFHAQQMTEKYLKGFLVFHKSRFPKTHDLLELATLVLKIKPEIQKYEQELDMISKFYVETRYPSDYPDFSFEEAELAFKEALKIKGFVLEKIKQ
ncbi:MAG: HEPN domain-containing protein [Nitrospirae bacterium]|uniref:HEPN domain-containing protein n=1 Tax=Candidatus Magnetobacterium casense TaxID=1455061 RepID=UPI00058C3CAF|nr:HEPN domain-containing protein [Candidatus Magnetobacterium casensis]MBF0337940.1 HEPN domain-containing protein [Nitrospirota bacterium]